MCEEYTRNTVYGPPGCGKTTEIARLARRAVQKHGPDGVLICSFTNAAAHEIASRDTGVAKKNVGTMHHFAKRITGATLVYSEHFRKLWDQRHPTLPITWPKEAGTDEDTEPGILRKSMERADIDFGMVQLARAARDEHFLEASKFWKAWSRFLWDNDVTDFTGLLEQSLFFNEAPNGVKVCLFDEAQDFSRLEMEVAEHWARNAGNGVFVGDPDQTLYGFKGADPAALPPAEGRHHRQLNQSYRVPAVVLSYAQRVYPYAVNKDYHPRKDSIGGLRLLPSSDAILKTSAKAREDFFELIERVEGDGERLMILAQSNYLLQPYAKKLRLYGVPFHNPYQPANGMCNPLGRKAGLAGLARTFAQDWKRWTVAELVAILSALAVTGNLKRGTREEIKAHDGRGGGRSDIHRLVAQWAADDDAADRILSGDPHTFLDMVPKSRAPKLRDYLREIFTRRGYGALDGPPSVILGTIHSVKGGEAEHVMILPDLSPQGAGYYRRTRENKLEMLRLFYVAVTRSRDKVYLPEPYEKNKRRGHYCGELARTELREKHYPEWAQGEPEP